MYHSVMIVMIGNRHIAINKRVNAALLSCGDLCIADERGNGASDCDCGEAGAGDAATDGAENGDSGPDLGDSLSGLVVMI